MRHCYLPVTMGLLLAACGSENGAQVTTLEASGCDVARQTCGIALDEVAISLTLQPVPVALKPFSVKAQIEGAADVQQEILDFQMIGMEMGPNRYRLISEGSHWLGTATLPVCATSRTDWLAIVEFSHDDKQYRVNFPFTTR